MQAVNNIWPYFVALSTNKGKWLTSNYEPKVWGIVRFDKKEINRNIFSLLKWEILYSNGVKTQVQSD